MHTERPVRVLVLVEGSAPTAPLLAAIRRLAQARDARFRVLVPNPARVEVHLLHPERHDKAFEAELVLLEALPAFEAAAGGRVIGSVSIRHDPFEAVQELLLDEPVDEILVAVSDLGSNRWLQPDLAHRLAHLKLPVTIVDSDPSGGSAVQE